MSVRRRVIFVSVFLPRMILQFLRRKHPVYAILSTQRDGPGDVVPRSKFIIASSPRTGSGIFTRTLQDECPVGIPSEYLNPPFRRMLERAWGTSGDPEEYWPELLRRRTDTNGFFGLKAHWSQFQVFLHNYGARFLDEVRAFNWVFVYRQDKLAQAISWEKARQSWSWDSRQKPIAPVIYDAAAIYQRLAEAYREHEMWEQFFAEAGYEPFPLSYEEISADPQSAFRRLFQHIGADPEKAANLTFSASQRQRNQTTADWYARFVREENWPQAYMQSSGSHTTPSTSRQG